MKYAKAKEILPQALIQEIQKYIQGQYLYIPKDESEKKSWGENSGSKEDTATRNIEIKRSFYKASVRKYLQKCIVYLYLV
ncbi:MAG: Response regulator receiver protein [Clostridium butyricum DORA_1]|nr:MAG: Response regulator receiver protein [Clostridium butyricum DORA_1]